MASTTICEHIRNPNTNWKCIGCNTNLLAEQISAIHLVAHENVENVGGDGQPPTNHWTLFLALEDGGSIQVNVCPGTPVPGRCGYPGLILVSPESCAFADANVAVVSGTPESKNTTIEDIFSRIIANGRDRYEFAPVGEGCRYWLQNVISDLVQAGIIDTSFAEAAHTTGGLHSGRTQSEWLQGVYGPVLHASPTAFTNYLNWWLTDNCVWNPNPRPELFLSPAHEHVLVHRDLAPRNMIMDDNGKLWIVDWGYAGFYPAYMVMMRVGARNRAMPWMCENTWAG